MGSRSGNSRTTSAGTLASTAGSRAWSSRRSTTKAEYTQDLPQGAVVVEINRSPVEDLAAAKALLHPGRNLLLVYSQGYQRYVAATKR